MRRQQPPWSVRGVSQEARVKAAKAAGRRRMTIGEWVTNALITMANEDLGTGPRRAAAYGVNGGTLQTQPEASELADALQTLTQRIEESGGHDRAVAALSERLEGLERADQTMTALAHRFADLDRRDRTLLSVAERLMANERKTEERLATLARAVATLAERLQTSGETEAGALTPDDLARALVPVRDAVETLAARVNGGADAAARRPGPRSNGSNGRADDENQARPVQPYPRYDFDKLNRRAIYNTKRFTVEELTPARRGNVITRLFGSG